MSRFELADSDNSLEIIFTRRKNWLRVFDIISTLFSEGMFFLLGFFITGALVLAVVPKEFQILASLAFLPIWIIVWVVLFRRRLNDMVWVNADKVIMSVTPHSIKLHRQLLGYRWSRDYLAENIRLWTPFARQTQPVWQRLMSWMMLQVGSIWLYDLKANQMDAVGAGLNEAEAKQILAAIQQRFPQYQS